MTHIPLSSTIPEEASPWVLKRQSRLDVYSDDFPENNMIIGDPCYPKQVGNCSCGLPWSATSLTMLCWFTRRTSVGTVTRWRYAATCKRKKLVHWSPSCEYIHAISLQEWTYKGEYMSAQIISDIVCHVHSSLKVFHIPVSTGINTHVLDRSLCD